MRAAIAKRAHLTLLVAHQHDVYCADPDRRRILADLRRPGRGVPIVQQSGLCGFVSRPRAPGAPLIIFRSEEHTSELQSLMRISYAVFFLKKKKNTHTQPPIRPQRA